MSADADLDLKSADAVCDVLERAADANLSTPGRTGAVVDLPATGRLLVSGDLHDHRFHYDKVVATARLGQSADRHVVLQELIHGPSLINGMDFSYRLLARAAALKIARPAQVHQLLSNHELAQVLGEGILKDGVSVVGAYDDGLGAAATGSWSRTPCPRRAPPSDSTRRPCSARSTRPTISARTAPRT